MCSAISVAFWRCWSVNTLRCSDLMAFIAENADSQEYVNPNIVMSETESFLETGDCESGTNLAQS